MIFGLVAVGALEIPFSHVDINVLGGEVETFIQVSVLDAVATAAVEVTLAAVLARRRADRFGGRDQINSVSGVAVRALAVRGRIRMADEAIYIQWVIEIVVCIRPAVTRVARGAFDPVGLNADAEVVDLILLSNRDRLIASRRDLGLGFPGEV